MLDDGTFEVNGTVSILVNKQMVKEREKREEVPGVAQKAKVA